MAGELGVLNALDVAKTQWYHFTAIVIAGMGFFTDAYDLFCISLVTKLLGRIYYTDIRNPKPGVLPHNVQTAVTFVPLCGTLAGQLFFGWLGDKLGRKKVYGLTLMLMVVCSIGSGLSFGSSAKGVMATLCFFRFWLSFAIGGNYSLSPTIVSEYANKRTRGTFIAAVFAMQGFGILAGGVVVLIVSSVFDHSYKVPPYQEDAKASLVLPAFDYVWRIILMFSAVPAALAYCMHLKMPETARYTVFVANNAKQAALDMYKVLNFVPEARPLLESQSQQYGLFSMEFAKRHGLYLVGITITSFLSGICVYSQNLYHKDIFRATGWVAPAEEMNAIHEVYRIARAQTFIALCSMPGYWFTVAFIDYIGRVKIQLIGFVGISVFMFATSPYKHWTKKNSGIWFVMLYSLNSFFANFGPNATTFVVPAEIFPARLRATCHGISAAAGKAGAIVGAFWFSYAAHNDPTKFMMVTFIILGVISLIGFIFTILVPESKGKTLEELSGENEDDGAEAIWL